MDPAVAERRLLTGYKAFDLFKGNVRWGSSTTTDDTVVSILHQHNLFGLDSIDLRDAAQLAQFAVLMKAAQYLPDVWRKR